jgi:hypothetical protein
VCGCGRSGSTLLDRMLGRLPGHVSVGEVEKFWVYGLKNDHLCSCGRPFSECEFWSGGGVRGLGPGRADDIDRILSLRHALRMRHLLQIVFPRCRSHSYARRLASYLGVWCRVLEAIRDVSGGEVIVDSSKVPHPLFALHQLEEINLRVVHLVRDSRGVAYSCGRKKPALEHPGSRRNIKRSGPLAASLGWLTWNALAEGYRRHGGEVIRLRYEDLIENPRMQLERITKMNGDGAEAFDFIEGNRVSLGSGHLLGGNPMRFQHGELPLSLDEEWRRNMPPWKRRLVTSVTLPLLRAYGYPLSAALERHHPSGLQ